jgi:hypothetical protein
VRIGDTVHQTHAFLPGSRPERQVNDMEVVPKALDGAQPAAAFLKCSLLHVPPRRSRPVLLDTLPNERVSPSPQQAVDSSKRQQAARSPRTLRVTASESVVHSPLSSGIRVLLT